MDKIDLTWALTGHLTLAHAADLIEASRRDVQSWWPLAGLHGERHDGQMSLFHLYRLDLVRRLLEAGLETSDIAAMSLDQQRRHIARLVLRPRQALFDFADLFAAAERFDMQDCFDLLAEAGSAHGQHVFLCDFIPALMGEIGRRWGHRETSVAQEHLLSATVRHHLGSLLARHRIDDLATIRIIVTTPHGELHDIGSTLVTLLALMAGHRPCHLGAQSPVAEIMAAVDACSASVVCLAVSFLDPARLAHQVRQLREVLPAHVILCLGGHAVPLAGLSNLPATLAYQNMASFIADMTILKALTRSP